MDRQKKAALLVGTVLVAGIEHENVALNSENQPTISKAPSVEIVFGRLDHGPENWPHAPHTFQDVVTMVTSMGQRG